MSPDARPVRALLIDLDGTLADTIGDFELALGRTLAELGHAPVGRAFIERTVGQGSEHLIRSTLAEAGAAPALFDAAWAAYQRHYRAVNGQASQLYPGVTEGLSALVALGLPLVCLTNKPGDFAEALLVAKGLRGHFVHVFGGDAFARKKPHPMPLQKACEALGTAPAETLMVGDSRNDVQAAQAAGCPVVVVPYGYNHGEPPEAAGADAIVPGLDVLARALSSGRWLAGAPPFRAARP